MRIVWCELLSAVAAFPFGVLLCQRESLPLIGDVRSEIPVGQWGPVGTCRDALLTHEFPPESLLRSKLSGLSSCCKVFPLGNCLWVLWAVQQHCTVLRLYKNLSACAGFVHLLDDGGVGGI